MSTLGFLKGTHGLLGLRAKQACEDTVERARAEMDDIVAEATYLNETVYGVEDEEDSASDTAAETVPAKA